MNFKHLFGLDAKRFNSTRAISLMNKKEIDFAICPEPVGTGAIAQRKLGRPES